MAEVGAGTGDSRPRMQSAATVCAPMDKMPHHRRVREGCTTTEERVDRSNLGPHEATEEPMLVRAPSPAFFARKDQVFDLR